MERFAVIHMPIGPIGVVASQAGLTHLYLMRRTASEAVRWLERRHPGARREQGWFSGLRGELALYFSGRPVSFTATVDLSACTEFQRRVLFACMEVGHGQTVTYGELARRVGCPGGARAVGGAMARNPVPLVVPCHRVVAGNGSLGGFSAELGVSLKRYLLELESGLYACSDARRGALPLMRQAIRS